MDLGDEDLLRRVAEGDSVAFATLYDRYSSRVFGLALKLVGERQEAQDVLQDVFLEVWKRAAAFNQSLGSAQGWILMITRGRSIDHIRKRVRERKRVTSLDPPQHAQALDAADADWVARILPDLSTDLRDVVHLAYARGQTRDQIAQTLGIPVGTVKTRLRTAVAQMSATFAREGRAAP